MPDVPKPHRSPMADRAVVWRGGAVNWGLASMAIGMLALGLTLLVARRDGTGTAIAVIGPLLAVWAQVRVAVTADAVVMRFGWAPWPRMTRPLRDVRAANVGEAYARRYWGWGLRGGSNKLIVLIRGGEALRLLNRDGSQFLVTVNNAADAAAAVQAQLALLTPQN